MNLAVKAHGKNIRVSAQKARLVVDLVRGLPVADALNTLSFNNKKSSPIIKKIIESAIANAEHNHALDIDLLKVSEIYVHKAKSIKRFTARAKGRGNKIEKQLCHIDVIVSY